MPEGPSHADTKFRAGVRRLVESSGFQHGVTALIALNAITLGLETSDRVMAQWGSGLEALDHTLLVLFTIEIALRMVALRGRYFRDAWGLFDLLVVGIAWLPATDALSVLRALRVLRVLRLLRVVPSLRNVVEAMLGALPGMGSITLLMLLLMYVAAVMATKLYGADFPERFGTLGASVFTLFQIMTLDDWANIVGPAIDKQPWAWLFFVPFILIATFIVLNLFIGVIVESVQAMRDTKQSADTAATRDQSRADSALLLRELRALRTEVAALRERQGAA